MNLCVVWTIFLVYFTQNVCFCDDPTEDPVTAGVVATAITTLNESTKSSTASPTPQTPPKIFISPEKYRLPRTVLPEFYKLNIFTHINDEEGFKFYGDVRIKVHIHNSCLHIFHLVIHFFFLIGLLTSFGAFM